MKISSIPARWSTWHCVQRRCSPFKRSCLGFICVLGASTGAPHNPQLRYSPLFTARACLPFLSPGIPLVCFLVLLPLNIPWSQISVTWLGVVHFLACLSPQLGSVVYHLFMNHEGGEPVYHTLLKLDVCGICMINTLGKPSFTRLSRFLHPPSFCVHCQTHFCYCWSVCSEGGFSYLLIRRWFSVVSFAWRCISINLHTLVYWPMQANNPSSKMIIDPLILRVLAYYNKNADYKIYTRSFSILAIFNIWFSWIHVQLIFCHET